ncbi:MAG: ketoacyl-ACP synthase III [Chloroflexi bacterium]|nr:ketoacyl-ACP synthase III [Chloroflexota bacterium]
MNNSNNGHSANGSNGHHDDKRRLWPARKNTNGKASNGNGPLERLTHINSGTTQFQRRYAHIVGWGMAVPERILTNNDLAAIVETNDEWIVSRTGISERRIADEKETTGQLALKAAQAALEVANILPTDIDMIVVATSTPEFIFPSTASQIQGWLGASKAGAFDLSAACSGFVYAVDMMSSKIRAGDIEVALIIGAETMSKVIDWSDRGTCILFGDGAGAIILQASREPGGVLSSVLRSDGSGWDALTLPTVGSTDAYLLDQKLKIEAEDGKEFKDKEGHGPMLHRISMNGREVFRFATRVVSDSIKEALRLADLTLDDVTLIVPHQANQRIIESAARSLKIPEDRLYSNIKKYGNTSAASIPIALCEAIEDERIKPGDNVVFVGFGGGLAWASMVVKWAVIPEKRNQTIMEARRQITYWYANQRRGVVKTWRRAYNKLAGSATPNATMEHLRKKLERNDWE